MRTVAPLAVAMLASLIAAGPARAEVQVTMHDGLVSVNAKDATIRQILAEWAKVGQTKIVNAEGIVGEPVTLLLTDVPEEQALEILLRSASGYLAAPRAVAVSNASRFDRILVMPTSTPSRSTAASAPPPAFPQPRAQASFPGNPGNDGPTDDDLARNGPPPAPPLGQRAPAFNTFPPPINPQPQDGPGAPGAPGTMTTGPAIAFPVPPVSTPAMVTGVAVPGMIVQPPAPQPQPGQPQQPGATPR
jgi:hypothetical protein